MALHPRASRDAGRPRLLTILTLTALLAAGTTLPAAADPVPPSQDDVDAARQSVINATASVAAMDVEMASLTAIQEAAFNAAAAAGEAYNQALVDLDAATVSADEAQARSDAASLRAEESRKLLVGLARDTSRNGGGLEQLSMYLSADGVSEAVSTANAMALVGSKADTAAQQYQADSVVSSTLEGIAADALADRQVKADDADAALEETLAAQAAAERAVQTASVNRDALLVRLAEARSTSVEVEQARQDGLQAERDRQAELLARQRAEVVAQATVSSPTSATTPTAPVAPPQVTTPTSAPTTAPAPSTPTVTPSTPSTPTAVPSAPAVVPPVVTPPVVTPPVVTSPVVTPPVVKPPSSGNGLGTGTSRGTAAQGQAAVDWAMTKLGLPYVWGATGPDAYDCSGLTSRAWAAAGRSINRTSRDQYTQVLKIDLNSMRPGDLVFWATNPNDASTIFHVAMYAGNNKIVEAAQPGIASRLTAMRWNSTLMPFAGRP